MLLTSAQIASRLLWGGLILMFPYALYLILLNKTIFMEWHILTTTSSQMSIIMLADPKGTLFASAVLFISANVIMFANTYMHNDPFMPRFIALVLLFVMSMNLLIFIPHMMALLLGWDGLGIVSFILVIYYQNPKSLAAGMITALTNRIGDVMILLSIGWTLNQGHWNIMSMWETPMSKAIIMMILIAGMTKSAQMPFSSWLPAAMAAPTPVSALVHSSTLVTAGVFLLIRFYPFMAKLQMFKISLLVLASCTMLMAGASALTENDMKKIIALSTLSQLGVMMASLGMGLPNLAFFHLITHALFKALLFICAGTLIHLTLHSQDLRTLGHLTPQLPLTLSAMSIANMALCGFPFLAGFYSKDMILETATFNKTNLIAIMLMMFATALTMAYSIRLMVTALWAPMNSSPLHMYNDNESDCSTPMLCLSTGAIVAGAILNWSMLMPMQEPFLPLTTKQLPLVMTLLGLWALWFSSKMSLTAKTQSMNLTSPHHMNALMWYLVPFSTQKMLPYPMLMAHQMLKTMDQGWSESMGGQGMNHMTKTMSTYLQPWQDNIISTQLLLMLLILVPLCTM